MFVCLFVCLLWVSSYCGHIVVMWQEMFIVVGWCGDVARYFIVVGWCGDVARDFYCGRVVW